MRALSPLRCVACRVAIGLMERFERRDGRNYHVGCVPGPVAFTGRPRVATVSDLAQGTRGGDAA